MPLRQTGGGGAMVGLVVTGTLALLALPACRPNVAKPSEHRAHAPPPAVFFEPSSFNYGTVFQAQTIEHSFQLVNQSTNDLRIVSMRASCSCTLISTSMLGKILKPGEKAPIPVSFETGARSGPNESFLDLVLKGDNVKYMAQARLYGEINADFLIQPPAVDFGTVRPGQTEKRFVTFQPNAQSALELATADNRLGPFDISIRNSSEEIPGRPEVQALPYVTITLKAPEGDRRQNLAQLLKVSTSSKRVPNVEIPVRAEIVPDYEITPEVLVLTASALAGESQLTLRSTAPSRITRISKKTNEDVASLPAFQEDEERGKWLQLHNIRVTNSILASAERIVVDLEIRNGTGNTETRSATIQVVSLK